MHSFRRNALYAALVLSGCLLAAPGMAMAADEGSPQPTPEASGEAQSSTGVQTSTRAQAGSQKPAKGVKQLKIGRASCRERV